MGVKFHVNHSSNPNIAINNEVIDGIGDCVVVLTNLAELVGVPIEICIEAAYDEIKNRTGKMENGTYKKD